MTLTLKPQIYIKSNVTKREQDTFQPRCSSCFQELCMGAELLFQGCMQDVKMESILPFQEKAIPHVYVFS